MGCSGACPCSVMVSGCPSALYDRILSDWHSVSVHVMNQAVAARSRGTPRIANRLLRRVRDYAEVRSDGFVNREVADAADAALDMLEVDRYGLDSLDRSMLLAIMTKFDGGPDGAAFDASVAQLGRFPEVGFAPAAGSGYGGRRAVWADGP